MTRFRKQKFKPQAAFKFLSVAQDDLYSAQVLFSAPKYRPETVLYHVQQCLEKSIKAVIIYKQLSVPLTHDLDVLLSELPEDSTSALPSGIGELTSYATIRRYSDGEEIIEPKDIEEAFDVAKHYLNWAQHLIVKP